MARRKLLEDTPIPCTNEDPVVFDTSEIPWWAWVRRFHLPEVRGANGRGGFGVWGGVGAPLPPARGGGAAPLVLGASSFGCVVRLGAPLPPARSEGAAWLLLGWEGGGTAGVVGLWGWPPPPRSFFFSASQPRRTRPPPPRPTLPPALPPKPKAEKLNGRAAMVGYVLALGVDQLTGVGLLDQQNSFLGKVLLHVAVFGILLIRRASWGGRVAFLGAAAGRGARGATGCGCGLSFYLRAQRLFTPLGCPKRTRSDTEPRPPITITSPDINKPHPPLDNHPNAENRTRSDVAKYKGLIDEATFYDSQWTLGRPWAVRPKETEQ